LRVFSLTKIYSKYIKNVCIKLASLKSMFQYKSNDNNFTQYNQVLVALFIRSKFALKCACALFLKTEVVADKIRAPYHPDKIGVIIVLGSIIFIATNPHCGQTPPSCMNTNMALHSIGSWLPARLLRCSQASSTSPWLTVS
jgi:hypothetical protein